VLNEYFYSENFDGMPFKLTDKIEYTALSVAIIILTIIIAQIVGRVFSRLVKRSTEVMKNDPTNYLFLGHTVRFLIYMVGFSLAIYSIPNLRVVAKSLLAGAGVLAVAIGFASQQALSNIISGMFIVIFKPYRITDRLKIGEMVGIVEDITLRHTVLRDFYNKRIIIPNSLISNEILVNADIGDERICKFIEFGISYDSDLKKAKELMREEVLKHPFHIDYRNAEDLEKGEDLVPVRVIGLGDSSVNIRAWAWAKDSPNAFIMECDLYENIKLRFDAEGIEIPFPHRTIVQKEKKTQ